MLCHDGELPRIHYCHVPKCAGTSVSTAIWEQIYKLHEDLKHCRINERASYQAESLFDFSMMDVRKTILAYNLSLKESHFSSGHVYCGPTILNEFKSTWQFVTLLRNPVHRWVSEYVYNTYKRRRDKWSKIAISFEEYLESDQALHSSRAFLYYFSNFSEDISRDPNACVKEALENLLNFRVVGTVEHIDLWRSKMASEFGFDIQIRKTNRSPNRAAYDKILADPKIIKRVEELCHFDLQIYEQCVIQCGRTS